jgi:hypothetical protein
MKPEEPLSEQESAEMAEIQNPGTNLLKRERSRKCLVPRIWKRQKTGPKWFQQCLCSTSQELA